MMKSSVTINLVKDVQSGPWIFWNSLDISSKKASALGFDGIELFMDVANSPDLEHLKTVLEENKLQLAAIGSGAGKVIHGLTLTDPDKSIRKKAIQYIIELINYGAYFKVPVIIGSMQGNKLKGVHDESVMGWLSEALTILGNLAGEKDCKLIYEPLNRYESNILNTLEEGAELIKKTRLSNIRLLADFFHMNIEEVSITDCILKNADIIGHIHFVDSNRRPAGSGHINMFEVAEALKSIGYSGYLSAEAFPWPNPDKAAEKTLLTFKKFFSDT